MTQNVAFLRLGIEQLITCIMNYAVRFQFISNALTVLRAKEGNASSIFLPLKQETLSFFLIWISSLFQKYPSLTIIFREFAVLGKETEWLTVVKWSTLILSWRLTGTLSILTKRTQNDHGKSLSSLWPIDYSDDM